MNLILRSCDYRTKLCVIMKSRLADLLNNKIILNTERLQRHLFLIIVKAIL